jgi:putative phosphoesterase
MSSKILVISDIHGNFPALEAVARQCGDESFAMIINCGDATVYATFPNETLDWLRNHHARSILGNTDRKILKLLKGKAIKKPRMAEKRVMYTWTAEQLTPENREHLAGMPSRDLVECEGFRIGIFHGSPDNEDEFLFNDTPTRRFQELANKTDCDIVLAGHSHSPFHKKVNNVHFVNPGSVGRMFDKNPAASYATLELAPDRVKVGLFRCPYDIEKVVGGLRNNLLPPIYEEMYRSGRKLN